MSCSSFAPSWFVVREPGLGQNWHVRYVRIDVLSLEGMDVDTAWPLESQAIRRRNYLNSPAARSPS